MIINLEEDNNAIKVISTQSRRADLSPLYLAEVHRTLGRILSYEFIKYLELEEIEIDHVQGKRIGLDISNKDFTLLLVLMRSGLYVAEGFFEILNTNARLIFINNTDDVSKVLKDIDCSNKNIVIVDSVINTGKSIMNIIKRLPKCKSKTCICQVMQAGFVNSAENIQEVRFITCRISNNFYIGEGKTDTGNRLFGHL